jgi:hypothetical protein
MDVELEDPEWVRAGRTPLAVDHWLEVHWRMGMASDDWTGDVQFFPATYKVTRFGENQHSDINVYGTLISDEDKKWLEKAVAPPAGQYESIKHLARVHELGLKNPETGRGMFRIEVLTGTDRDALVSAVKREEWLQFAKQHWWQISLALVIAYWWFF